MATVIIVFVVGVSAFWAIAVRNSFVRSEQTIIASYDKSRSWLSNLINKLTSMGITAEHYTDAFQSALQISLNATYKDKPNLLAILESSAALPSDQYDKIQQAIDNGYDEFYNTQLGLIDTNRAYIASTKEFPNNLVANILGYPTAEFISKDYNKLVLNQAAKTAFETGTMDPINPFSK